MKITEIKKRNKYFSITIKCNKENDLFKIENYITDKLNIPISSVENGTIGHLCINNQIKKYGIATLHFNLFNFKIRNILNRIKENNLNNNQNCLIEVEK